MKPAQNSAGSANPLSQSKPTAAAPGQRAGMSDREKAYATGYDKGKSNAVKQQYWLYVSMQKQRNQVNNVRLYPVQLPEQRIDGVTSQPSTKLMRIEE